MDVRKLNLPLPAVLHEAVFREARRRGTPATRLVRQIVSEWLVEQERARQADEIRRFAMAHSGSDIDLDPRLEAAGLEVFDAEPEDAES